MAQPLTDGINALTTYANSVTGQSDSDLSSAVATLASGYGGGSDVVDLATMFNWEVGAVGGQTGRTYVTDKSSNDARLRTANLISLPNMSCTFSMDWTNYQAQYKPYNVNALGVSNFIVMTQDTVIPPTYPYIAIVIRHTDGTTQMDVSDLDFLKPTLTFTEGD